MDLLKLGVFPMSHISKIFICMKWVLAAFSGIHPDSSRYPYSTAGHGWAEILWVCRVSHTTIKVASYILQLLLLAQKQER